MQTVKLSEFLTNRRDRGEPLVLATVIETRGSTYSKAGARMLIDGDGIFQGMLSGGCLEGDLAIRAQQVIDTGVAQTADYDLGADNDALWGLGVGCDGAMRIFLQPVSAASDYEPIVTLLDAPRRDAIAAAVTVVASDVPGIVPGATRIATAASELYSNMPAGAEAAAGRRLQAVLESGRASLDPVTAGDAEIELFASVLMPVPRLLILGAGLDVEPLLVFATDMGWRTTVCDHRPAYIDNTDLAAAEATRCCPADELADAIDLDRFDAAVVMSHHLDSDRRYLRALAASRVPYVGLLGPPGRRDRLLSELGDAGERLRGRLRGPAGLDIGGRGPAAIALSIAAEIQQQLASGAIRRGRAGSNE